MFEPLLGESLVFDSSLFWLIDLFAIVVSFEFDLSRSDLADWHTNSPSR